MSDYYAPPTSSIDQPSIRGEITGTMLESLRMTKGWVMLVGVALLVAAALTLFAGVALIFAGGMAGPSQKMPMALSIGMAGFYALFAFIYAILASYLIRYSRSISRLLADYNPTELEFALAAQQKFWRLAGSMMLIGIAFAVLGILAAIVIPMLSKA